MSRLNVANFRHPDGTADNLNLDSSGRVGIGTTTPGNYDASGDNLVVSGSGDSGITIVSGTSNGGNIYFADGTTGNEQYRGWITYTHGSTDALRFGTTGTERARITSDGEFRFNSGYGSVATAFGVRAWINFDGTAATIGSGRASGNMDAVTDNGTGDYTINFTNDMPDANYCVQISIELDDTVNTNNFGVKNGSTPAVGSVRVAVGHEGGTLDTDRYFVSIIR